MNSDQQAESLSLGLIKAEFANVAMSLIGTGVHIFMACYGLYAFLEAPKHERRARTLYIVASFAITAVSAVCAVVDATRMFRSLFEARSGIEYYLVIRQREAGSREPLFLLSNSSLRVLILIGDSLMVYRCLMIWRENMWIAIPPALTCLGSFATGITTVARKFTLSRIPSTQKLEIAAIYLTVSTNVMVTALIVFYILRERHAISRLRVKPLYSKLYTGVIALVIESALPLSVVGVVFATLYSLPTPNDLNSAPPLLKTEVVFSFLFYGLCSLAPHIIIFRVTTGRSWGNQVPRSDPRQAVSAPINFAHRHAVDFGESSSVHSSWVNQDTNTSGVRCTDLGSEMEVGWTGPIVRE